MYYSALCSSIFIIYNHCIGVNYSDIDILFLTKKAFTIFFYGFLKSVNLKFILFFWEGGQNLGFYIDDFFFKPKNYT